MSDDVGKKYLVGMVMDCNRLPRHNLNINWNALHSTLEHLPLRPLLKLSHQSPRELYTWAARHTAVHPVSKNAKMSEMAEMSNMTARHVMCSLGGPAV